MATEKSFVAGAVWQAACGQQAKQESVVKRPGERLGRRMLAICNEDKLRRELSRMLSEERFLARAT
jgi:hypothetical protein